MNADFSLRFISRSIKPNQYPGRYCHEYGELYYSHIGTMDLIINNQHYLAPNQYCLWLPPQTVHRCSCQHETTFMSLHIDPALANHLSQQVCVLTISPLLKNIFHFLYQQPPAQLALPSNQRLLAVAYDQLLITPSSPNYLPKTNDILLAPILSYLEKTPSNNDPIALLAKKVNSTERTVMRHAMRELGMSISEWKSRLRVIKAITLLDNGISVESIALELGYVNASAFITMFYKIMGVTPGKFRKASRTDQPDTPPLNIKQTSL